MKRAINVVGDPTAADDDCLNKLGGDALHEQSLSRYGRVTKLQRSHKTLSSLPRAGKAVCQKSKELLEFKEAPGGRKTIQPTKTGWIVINALSIDFLQVQEEFTLYRLSPITLLFMWLVNLLPWGWKKSLGAPLTVDKAFDAMQFANRLIAILRRKLERPAFKKAEANFRKSARDNFNNYFDAIARVAQSNETVVSIRFDLYYRASNSQPARLGDPASVETLDPFLALCGEFQEYLSDHFGKDLLHFAWAFEHGREGGFHKHYHLLLRPGGNEDHARVVDGLAQKWQTMTLNQGWMHNGNRFSSTYPHKALGIVRLDDPEVIEGLRRIVSYFTLAGLFVKLDVPGRTKVIRAFQQSNVVKPKRERGGRPPRLSPGWRGRMTVAEAQAVMRFM